MCGDQGEVPGAGGLHEGVCSDQGGMPGDGASYEGSAVVKGEVPGGGGRAKGCGDQVLGVRGTCQVREQGVKAAQSDARP